MTRNIIFTFLAAGAALLAAPGFAYAEAANPIASASATTLVRSGYAKSNGVNYYYEIHGQGEPLLLLHGGLGSIDMFGPVLPALAQRPAGDRRRPARSRPHSARRPRHQPDRHRRRPGGDPGQLGYDQVDALGYSFGGGVAFRLAVQHPDMVRRLVMVSAGYAEDGFYPEMLPQQAQVGAAMADMMKDTPMYQSYVAVAPKPEEFPKLLERMGELMRKPYDWSADVEEADDAVDARLRRQRHVPPRARREVLPAARRRAEGRRLDARAHVAEPPGDHSRTGRTTRSSSRPSWSEPCAAVPRRRAAVEELGGADARTALETLLSALLDHRKCKPCYWSSCQCDS